MKNLAVLLFTLCVTFANAQAATIIKIATVAPDGTAWMREMRAAAEAVKAHTGDRVEIKYYPGGVMGDPATVLRKIKIGQLQGGAFVGGEAASITADANVYSLPFEFRNQDEVDKVRGKLDPLLKQSFAAAGFEAVGISGGGFAYLMSAKDVRNKDDLKSAKVWVPQGDTVSEGGLEAAGVTGIPLPLADVYTSLQTGLIDTAANTPAGAIAFQWHTKIKHVLDLPLSYVVGLMLIDKKAYDALTPDDSKALADEFGSAFARLDKINRDDNAQAREALSKQGVAIAAPNAADAKSWEDIGITARKKLGSGLSPAMSAALAKALDEARSSSK